MRLQVRGRLRSRRSRVLVLLGLLGPGLIAANAGNDAGGIATYSEVGAKYGFTLLWAMVLITISLALVQRSAARMGVVTGKGLAELIRERYGIRWSAFATFCVLVANFGICVSDFVGVGFSSQFRSGLLFGGGLDRGGWDHCEVEQRRFSSAYRKFGL